MRQTAHTLQVATRGKGLYEVTSGISSWLAKQSILTGLLTVFCRHTSASLVIQENADPDVRADLERYFERIAPEDARAYAHTIEGPDDMPAHIRAALTQVQLSIPVVDGELVLGAWQGIYLFEHRSAAHRRSLVLHLLGE
ncbi:MAG: YjbQ family protein [Bryobacterales bacterium]|nr:YjbQ family protein [Bryobacterales bacterium]